MADPYPPPQGQYPPPTQAQYPPPQGQYPPPQGAYPPDAGQYPPPDAAQYPPQYPPAAAYPPPGQVPPPYPGPGDYKPPPDQQQQTSTNVVVVQQQPTAHGVVTTHIVHSDIPDYFVLSIVLTILCIFFNWCALFCTIPAIFLSIQSRDDAGRGDRAQALQHSRTALYLDIASVVFTVVVYIIWIIAVAAG